MGAEALPELERVTRSGGVILLKVKGKLCDAGSEVAFQAVALDVLEVTAPHISMPGKMATKSRFELAMRAV